MKFSIRIFLLFFLLSFVGVLHASEGQNDAERLSEAPVDWRFGIVETYEDPAAAAASGAAWTRVRFQWAEVQAGGPESWTPMVSGDQISGEVAAGRKVVGLLIGIPGWANEEGVPRGLYLPHDDPGNTWGVFVRQAVGRYQGQINNWVIWNEPDVWDKAAPGHTWDGTVQDFAQLLKVAYLSAKEANPNAVIHLSAFTYFWDANYGRDQYFALLLDEILKDPNAEANNYYFDVATAHLYFQPAVIYDVIQAFFGMMSGRGILKPIWVVETNAPPTDDPAWEVPNWTFWVSQQEQAAYIPQVFAVSLAAGAQRVAIYKMKDLDSDVGANPEPFGLVRRDGSRRPAFNSYQVAVRYMAGTEATGRLQWDEAAHIKLNQGSQSTHVLFSRVPGDRVVRVEATAETAILADMWGQQRTIQAQNGVFTVNVPAAPCGQSAGNFCMIGGPVFYLVQGIDGASPGVAAGGGGSPVQQPTEAVAAAEPTAAPTAEPTVTPSATATAAATATSTITPTSTPSPTATVTSTPEPSATPTAVPSTPTATAAAAEVAALPPESSPVERENSSPDPGFAFAPLLTIGLGGLLLIGILLWWWRRRSI